MPEGLNERIRAFYDQSTPLWLNTWGEQMHHGYYGPDGKREVDHQQAQLDMIDELLAWGGAPPSVTSFLDAGCGVGGSSRYLAGKYPQATGLGVTLSPVQAEHGNEYNALSGVDDRLRIIAKDVYTLDPEVDGTYDLIWSMESAEHMADKQGLFELFHRMLKPGGRLLMATWCHRPEPPYLSPSEQYTLQQICKLYHLPPMVSIPQLADSAAAAGLQDIQTADWSASVEPFWGAVIKSGLDPRNWPGLVRSGMGTIQGAWAMKYMRQGFASGAIQYGVLRAVRK
ncbi:2-methyl-6-phytyl-1,4-hydroquinone methyltransferase [Neolewinella maritima]|uniref:2-methyl-6-phytyl-1,4-hydroquinone methyltransferase n=1 Tax=Neolewinella maritima TaxID=1383882 RepID=A0ABN8F8G4_9BACT|nr:methyltransferase domain-containing protein [Neolewinella maritima]CAH1000489.1 2-methyl-6-phytyl-1,4-hydroquinone methyltransferase [Neolewinella maritima]